MKLTRRGLFAATIGAMVAAVAGQEPTMLRTGPEIPRTTTTGTGLVDVKWRVAYAGGYAVSDGKAVKYVDAEGNVRELKYGPTKDVT